MTKRAAVLSLVASAFSLFLVSSTLAQGDYPNRAITMVVPFAAGGATDVIARIVADGMSQASGQADHHRKRGWCRRHDRFYPRHEGRPRRLHTAHRPYGDARIVLRAVREEEVRSANRLRADRPGRFCPHRRVRPQGLACGDISEFVALMKEKGPDFKVGHSGIGSNAHVTCTLLNALVGTKPTEIPYRGNGPLMNDLLAGEHRLLV